MRRGKRHSHLSSFGNPGTFCTGSGGGGPSGTGRVRKVCTSGTRPWDEPGRELPSALTVLRTMGGLRLTRTISLIWNSIRSYTRSIRECP